jgi:hypothetical protein
VVKQNLKTQKAAETRLWYGKTVRAILGNPKYNTLSQFYLSNTSFSGSQLDVKLNKSPGILKYFKCSTELRSGKYSK